jgi:hypothetical protein
MEECCTVCADPLEFCAFGPCGHDTICSKCVTRMRLMQNSRSCVICKSPAEHVFVTRYMDEHTKRIPAQAWPDLPVRSNYRNALLPEHVAVPCLHSSVFRGHCESLNGCVYKCAKGRRQTPPSMPVCDPWQDIMLSLRFASRIVMADSL